MTSKDHAKENATSWLKSLVDFVHFKTMIYRDPEYVEYEDGEDASNASDAEEYDAFAEERYRYATEMGLSEDELKDYAHKMDISCDELFDRAEKAGMLAGKFKECATEMGLSEDALQEYADGVALSVEYRSPWMNRADFVTPGDKCVGGVRIVLTTGGPHCELQADVDDDGTAKRAQLLYADWDTQLTALDITDGQEADLCAFATLFVEGV